MDRKNKPAFYPTPSPNVVKTGVATKTMAVHTDGELTVSLGLPQAQKPSSSEVDAMLRTRQGTCPGPPAETQCSRAGSPASMTRLLPRVKIHHGRFPSRCVLAHGRASGGCRYVVRAVVWGRWNFWLQQAHPSMPGCCSVVPNRGPMVWKQYGKHCYGGKAGTELSL